MHVHICLLHQNVRYFWQISLIPIYSIPLCFFFSVAAFFVLFLSTTGTLEGSSFAPWVFTLREWLGWSATTVLVGLILSRLGFVLAIPLSLLLLSGSLLFLPPPSGWPRLHRLPRGGDWSGFLDSTPSNLLLLGTSSVPWETLLPPPRFGTWSTSTSSRGKSTVDPSSPHDRVRLGTSRVSSSPWPSFTSLSIL